MSILSSPHVLILGSRIYQPIADVDRALQQIARDATVTSFGSSDVCHRAVIVANSLGMDARNVTLEPSRASLIHAAKQPGAHVWLFVAIDPQTKQITQGISQIAGVLSSEGITSRQIVAPVPGRVCEQVTKLRQSVDKALTIPQPTRRAAMVTRTLRIVTETLTLRDEYEQKLTSAGEFEMLGNQQADAKWQSWLRSYEVITDATEDAKSVLIEVAA